jgi:thiol-disulfide isomerase/thioredoxin
MAAEGYRRAAGKYRRPVKIWVAGLLMLSAGAALAGELKPYRGGETPPLSLPALDGSRHSLEEYWGRVVLLNFWATWCPPCREEMPSMQRLQQKLAGEPFVVVAVNVGEDDQTVRAFLEKVPVSFPVWLDPDGITPGQWKVFAFPSSFLLDPQGRIRYTVYGGMDWQTPEVLRRIEELLPSLQGRPPFTRIRFQGAEAGEDFPLGGTLPDARSTASRRRLAAE